MKNNEKMTKHIDDALTEPVHYASIEQGWRGCASVVEVRAGWIHSKHHVQVALDEFRKAAPKLIVLIEHKSLPLPHDIAEGSQQLHSIFALEQARHLSTITEKERK